MPNVERDLRAAAPPGRLEFAELFAHREVLLNLVRKELKVKYTASVLGAVWSLLNPVVFLAVFTFVVRVLGNLLPDYPCSCRSATAWNFSPTRSRRARGR